jgi:hypothetical protein
MEREDLAIRRNPGLSGKAACKDPKLAVSEEFQAKNALFLPHSREELSS